MRKPFKKKLSQISTEKAHGGSGQRQLILSKDDAISQHLHAMTKGFLEPNAVFDWHKHDDIDEFFFVIKGTGTITFKDGAEFEYEENDLVYIPSNLEHLIKATGNQTNEFFFIRLNH